MTKIKMGYFTNLVNFAIIVAISNFHKPFDWYKRARNGSLPHSRLTRPLGMVAPDTAAHSETHRDTKEREPVKLGLHATVNPDTVRTRTWVLRELR